MKIRPGPLPSGGEQPVEDILEKEERWLRCASCGARVTKDAARIAMNGTHEHTFMNPSGIKYVVGCFSKAEGCVPDGSRSSVWSWFPGYAWQIELCRSCSVHLGWSFHDVAGTSFYGLIGDRLVD